MLSSSVVTPQLDAAQSGTTHPSILGIHHGGRRVNSMAYAALTGCSLKRCCSPCLAHPSVWCAGGVCRRDQMAHSIVGNYIAVFENDTVSVPVPLTHDCLKCTCSPVLEQPQGCALQHHARRGTEAVAHSHRAQNTNLGISRPRLSNRHLAHQPQSEPAHQPQSGLAHQPQSQLARQLLAQLPSQPQSQPRPQ